MFKIQIMKESHSTLNLKRGSPIDLYSNSPYGGDSSKSLKHIKNDYYTTIAKHFMDREENLGKSSSIPILTNQPSSTTNFNRTNSLKNTLIKPHDIIQKANYKFDLSNKIKDIKKKTIQLKKNNETTKLMTNLQQLINTPKEDILETLTPRPNITNYLEKSNLLSKNKTSRTSKTIKLTKKSSTMEIVNKPSKTNTLFTEINMSQGENNLLSKNDDSKNEKTIIKKMNNTVINIYQNATSNDFKSFYDKLKLNEFQSSLKLDSSLNNNSICKFIIQYSLIP